MSLQQFFEKNPRVAIAFSGGVDSSYLLYSAKAAGCVVHAYYLKSEFQPEFEHEDAVSVASFIGVPLTVVDFSVLGVPSVTENSADRCYFCKTQILEKLWELVRVDGFTVLCDGTNADDDEGDRPGMRALREQGVISPLRECGLTKSEIRELSKQAGLSTFDKPAYACLATRIPTGTAITGKFLEMVERAESALFEMGFSDFRVRLIPPATANIQMPTKQWDEAAARRDEIHEALQPDFKNVLLDLATR